MKNFMRAVLDEKSNNLTFIVFISLLVFIATYSYTGVAIQPGLDPSYKFAFNYFFEHSIQIGREILFSFGPFGFLLWPQSIGNNLVISYLVIGFFKFAFIFLALYLNSIAKPTINTFSFFTILFLTFVVALQIDVHNLLILVTALLLILHKNKGNMLFLIFSSMVVGFALTVKASSGILSILILFSYLMIGYISHKKISAPLISFLALCATFLLIWFLLYQNLSGIIDYLTATLELSSGNSSAMTINPQNNWWIFIFFLFSFFSVPFIQKDKNIFFLYFMMTLLTIVFFKYAFARADSAHVVHFLIYLFQFLYLILIVSKDIQKKDIFLLFIVFFVFILFIIGSSHKSSLKGFFKPISTNLSNKPITTLEMHTQNLKKRSKDLLSVKKLDHEAMEIIQDNTIDIYPWETSYIAANNLNWKPRPVFQSYITYTPYLDMKNANFYNSVKSPSLILWEKKHWGGEVESIDGRYLLNDEPLTLFQILNHYRPVYENPSFLLMRRADYELLSQPTIVLQGGYQWNTWLNVPNNRASTNHILRAKTNIKRTSSQKLKKLLYKEFEVYITYKFENGEEKKYRIVVDNAKNGLWINPFQEKLLKYDWANKVIAIKFTHTEGDYFENLIHIKWESIKINDLPSYGKAY